MLPSLFFNLALQFQRYSPINKQTLLYNISANNYTKGSKNLFAQFSKLFYKDCLLLFFFSYDMIFINDPRIKLKDYAEIE